jgi:hypothetical protein
MITTFINRQKFDNKEALLHLLFANKLRLA